MKDVARKGIARKRAEQYAPRPISSLLMYGFVGVCTAGLAWTAFSAFYDIDPLDHPFSVLAVLLLVFAGSAALWVLRSRRHAAAHRHEYDKPE